MVATRLTRLLPALVVLVGCASAPAVAGSASAPPVVAGSASAPPVVAGSASAPAVVDGASAFLDGPCREAPGEPFASAWLEWEQARWDVYGPLYYRTEAAAAERPALARELQGRRDELCLAVRTLVLVAPGAVAALAPRVSALMGAAPQSDVLLTVPLQWTDGRADTLGGRDVIALSARHDTFARTTGLAATVAHELVHAAHSARLEGRADALPPLARSLLREGTAVLAVQALLPELGDRALGFRPDAFTAQVAPLAAAELLPLLEDPDPGEAGRRFFAGGFADPVLPAKMGYLLGLRLLQALAEDDGLEAALRVEPAAFLALARAHLTALAGTSPLPTPPPGDLASLDALRDAFTARAAAAGVPFAFTPELREWTRPSIISWRERELAVALPRWSELPADTRAAIAHLAGGDAAAPWLFRWLFRWFFVPHELAHALQTHGRSHALSERQANDLAVAFLREQPGGPQRLATLAGILDGVLPRLAAAPDDADFDARYDALGQDPAAYAAFQLRSVADSLARRDALSFDEVARACAR